MKIRKGFVSNSSSTSFIVASKKKNDVLKDSRAWGDEQFNNLKKSGFADIFDVVDETLYKECIKYKEKGFDIYSPCLNKWDWAHDEIYEIQDEDFIILHNEDI